MALTSAVRSPQSDLSVIIHEKWAEFASSCGNKGRNSLQFRLHGGEGGILVPRFLLSACDPYTYATVPGFFSGLQANAILGYRFYSFSYSLQFCGKWYQWYQSRTGTDARSTDGPAETTRSGETQNFQVGDPLTSRFVFWKTFLNLFKHFNHLKRFRFVLEQTDR